MMKLSRKSRVLRPRYCELTQHFMLEFVNRASKFPNCTLKNL